ncbi:efflux RND transporter periplasmic adaptor subunit [Teredinibacter sp. KSP-S5-2]|uniref:efflux RND transporter periplasmic adaptor subunit n=1 Tax=Teredinibacter sp. KSP-S5-2 TaxID=3034506 RepID=UPI002934F29B|nr:efflux RND transporter periplasmic adaptor subunit [Teredinibacter sp. KSP-S5-2]WNO08741.1 efflux RND transporter periplasmic adaptor subunit [Teredinibacter sp. KSP-S5-2]
MAIRELVRRLPLWIKILIPGVFIIVMVVVLSPKPKPVPKPPETLTQVAVVPVQMQQASVDVITQGTVSPRREIDIVARVAGEVVSVAPNFVDGGFFNEDETLVSIDRADYEYALAGAKSKLANAEQALASERGRARQAKREWQDLGNRDANDLFLRKPQLAASEEAVKAAKADVNNAQLNLARTAISVPFAGRIRTTYADLGQYVTPGTRIARIYDTSVAEVRLPLTDRQVALVDLPLGVNQGLNDSLATVKVSAEIGGTRYYWDGKIKRTEASVDTQSRMYYAVAEIENPFITDESSGRPPLLVGLFVDVEIKGKQLDQVAKLPENAVFRRNRIYALDEKNVVQEKQVNVIKHQDGHVWIRDGLTQNTKVIVGQQAFLSPGQEVEPKPYLLAEEK